MKIAVTGNIRSGKNTVVDFIQAELEQRGRVAKELYFAEGIEDIIQTYFPEAYEGTKKPRRYFQEVGQFMRKLNPDVWINHLENKYSMFKEYGFNDFLVTDLRQMNEYTWLKENGFTIIKVEADSEVRIARMKEAGDKFDMQDLVHETERQIDSLPYDYLVTNNTTPAELADQVEFMIKDMEGKVV